MKMSPMKFPSVPFALLLFLCVGLTFSARATITGQWDFKTGYNATIGTAIFAQDPATAALTQFESTASFGISPIAGQTTNVMFFPQDTDGNYNGVDYQVTVGAAPNDTNAGGYTVNQYTVIMDVLFTNLPPAGKTFTLFGTDYDYFGGEFSVNSAGNVVCSAGGGGGFLTTNAWHRIAIAVDAADAVSGLEVFIDGTNVATQGSPSAVNGPLSIE
ncbi:MAG TPA: hypothetical protein VK731_01035, partial [Candidatus Cybelea sp.]|nr:hypothetical protein [Candidatus Cybelea sp.]